MRPLFAILLSIAATACVAAKVPQTVAETWADYDPRAAPLETELIRETVEDGIVLRQILYLVGTFGGRKTRVAAFYAFPQGGKELPGIVQVHGGGQRAMPSTARFWASQGYAAVAVNWGENVIGEEGDPNTDWAGLPAGFLHPKHHNDVTPVGGTLHDEPHPWNSAWLLYSAAARRAITFLERAPEADGHKIGLTGHSMGGRFTVLKETPTVPHGYSIDTLDIPPDDDPPFLFEPTAFDFAPDGTAFVSNRTGGVWRRTKNGKWNRFAEGPHEVNGVQVTADGTKLIGPTFKDLIGREQTVTRDGKTETVTTDDAYIHESITKPQAAVVKGYEAVPMADFSAVLSNEDIATLNDYLKTIE